MSTHRPSHSNSRSHACPSVGADSMSSPIGSKMSHSLLLIPVAPLWLGEFPEELTGAVDDDGVRDVHKVLHAVQAQGPPVVVLVGSHKHLEVAVTGEPDYVARF